MTRRKRPHVFVAAAVIAVLAMATAIPSAQASLVNLEALQSANSSLEFQYAFEGADDSTRLADGSGNGYTLQRLNGADGGDVNDIQFLPGFGGASQAYRPASDATNYRIGAGLNSISTTIPISSTVTVESVVQMDAYTLSNSNGSYVLSARPQPANGRAYFLRQLTGPDRLATTLGDTFGDLGGNIAYSAGDWYYLAMVASYDSGGNQSTVSWYYANLSAGETSLTAIGPDNTLFQGDWTGDAQIGIGNFLNGTQEYMQGSVDNIALYNSNLDEATLQSHLEAIYVPEPATLSLLALAVGLLAVVRRQR